MRVTPAHLSWLGQPPACQKRQLSRNSVTAAPGNYVTVDTSRTLASTQARAGTRSCHPVTHWPGSMPKISTNFSVGMPLTATTLVSQFPSTSDRAMSCGSACKV